jgi:hypothetical protein
MILHKELQELLRKRLEGTISSDRVEQLGREIEGLENDWEEIDVRHLDGSSCSVVNCIECWLEEQLDKGAEIRLYYLSRHRFH